MSLAQLSPILFVFIFQSFEGLPPSFALFVGSLLPFQKKYQTVHFTVIFALKRSFLNRPQEKSGTTKHNPKHSLGKVMLGTRYILFSK
jgi:hypothetical protein